MIPISRSEETSATGVWLCLKKVQTYPVHWWGQIFSCHNGQVNLHNAHFWDEQNPYWLKLQNCQIKWSFNVWCGIHEDQLLGPYFNQNLTSFYESHMTCRRFYFIDASDFPTRKVFSTWRSTTSCFEISHRFLGQKKKMNSRSGHGMAVPWPARPPDLNPLNFFFRGRIKSQVHEMKPKSKEYLQ